MLLKVENVLLKRHRMVPCSNANPLGHMSLAEDVQHIQLLGSLTLPPPLAPACPPGSLFAWIFVPSQL